MRSARVSFLTCIQTIRSERKGQKHWREVWSATPPSSLSISHVYSAEIDTFHTRACHFSRVFRQSDRKGRGSSTGAKSGAQLLPHLSRSLMYTLPKSTPSTHARVISHVYSANQIGKEGAEALARSLEHNSSLTSLHLTCTLCRYGCVQRACHFSRVFRQPDRKGRGESTGAKSGAQLVPHLSRSHRYTLQIWMRSARMSFLTCIQTI
jgi:hypothetical protein